MHLPLYRQHSPYKLRIRLCSPYDRGDTRYGGFSAIIDPWGETLALAAENEQILTAECEMDVLGEIRSSINVFRDRRPELYQI